MKVCIVAEGCYPYVVGGVSGWINSMIKSFPNIEFILLTIVANRSVRGKFVYELPENLTQVYELYLEDCEWEEGERERKVHTLSLLFQDTPAAHLLLPGPGFRCVRSFSVLKSRGVLQRHRVRYSPVLCIHSEFR